MARKISGPDTSRQLFHGFMKPFPSFKWCRFSLASSGTTPGVEDAEIVAAYRTAEVAEVDILMLLEKGRFCGCLAFVRERKRL